MTATARPHFVVVARFRAFVVILYTIAGVTVAVTNVRVAKWGRQRQKQQYRVTARKCTARGDWLSFQIKWNYFGSSITKQSNEYPSRSYWWFYAPQYCIIFAISIHLLFLERAVNYNYYRTMLKRFVNSWFLLNQYKHDKGPAKRYSCSNRANLFYKNVRDVDEYISLCIRNMEIIVSSRHINAWLRFRN